jgi:protein TonB
MRRARLSCTSSVPDCQLQVLSSRSVPTDELAVSAPSVAGNVGRIQLGGKVAAAKLIKKVQSEPSRGSEAGNPSCVKLHVIIGTDGTVVRMELVSGHPALVQSAVEAVRKWICQPTLIDGKPVEVDTEIDVIFSLGL